MNVFIACETSGEVRRAFEAKGHTVISCDILPADDGAANHRQCDVLSILDDMERWADLMICFPPCTHLAVSGARWFPAKRADGRQQAAEAFARRLFESKIPRIALENPVSILSRPENLGKPTQTFQPWMFGHGEVKRTCLWLKGLPPLKPTNIVEGREARVWKLPPTADRWKLRSKTFSGVAEAMADQWGTK